MALRRVPAEELVKAGEQLKMYPTYPYLDSNDAMWKASGILSCSTAKDTIRSSSWCDEMVIGDMANEGFMFYFLVSRMEKEALISNFEAVLGCDLETRLLESYDVRLDTNDAKFRRQTALMFGDLAISEPIDSLCHWLSHDPNKLGEIKDGPKIFRYQFDLPCPVPEALHEGVEGRPAADYPSAHGVDLMYLFMNLLERYPESENNVFALIAYGMARSWISFANGQGPQPSREEGGKGGILLGDVKRGLYITAHSQSLGQPFEGLSRPVNWQTIREVYRGAAASAPDDKRGKKVDQIRTALLDFGSILQKSA